MKCRNLFLFNCLVALFGLGCTELSAQGFINLRLLRTNFGNDATAWSVVSSADYQYSQDADFYDETDALAFVQDSGSVEGIGSGSGKSKHRAICQTPIGAWSLAPRIIAETVIEQSMDTPAFGPRIIAAGAADIETEFRVQENPNFPGQVENAELHSQFIILGAAVENENGPNVYGNAVWSVGVGRSWLSGSYAGGGAWSITGSIANGAVDVPINVVAAGLVIAAWEPISVDDLVTATARTQELLGIESWPTGGPGTSNHQYFVEPSVTFSVRVPN